MANDQQSYQQQIAQMRQERREREVQERVEYVTAEYNDALRRRKEAEEIGDREAWDLADADLEMQESNLREMFPQQPQMSPQSVEWLKKNESFRRRYGQVADQWIVHAHNNAVRAGFKPDTKPYFDAVETSLEVGGPIFGGPRYDPSDQMITPNEAAKISGLSPQQYNHAAQVLYKQGRIGQGKK
jgi:hypothetical protein